MDIIKVKESFYDLSFSEVTDTTDCTIHNASWMQSFINGEINVKYGIAFISKKNSTPDIFLGIAKDPDTNYYLAANDDCLEKYLQSSGDDIIIVGRGEDQFHLEFPYYVSEVTEHFDECSSDFDCALHGFKKIGDLYVAMNKERTITYIHSDRLGVHYGGY